jgi:uncharacterized protein YidB (DUF937 family)
MGLMDILNGMQNGPRGGGQAPASGGRRGMSPMTMALLGLLAYKALKGGGLGNILGGQSMPVNPPPGGSRGGLGDVLGGMFGNAGAQQGGGGGLGGVLGGLLAGGAAGGILSGGLRNLIGDMEQNGHGGAAQSWVSNGPNQSLSPNELGNALGAEDIDAVSQQTGMSRQDILSTLSQHLPEFVNQLTPNGRLPNEDEASETVSS